MDLWSLLTKILGKKLSDGKNYLIMLIVLVVISLNLLGFDIAKLSNTPYIVIILFLLNYIINILTDTYTMNKLSDIQRSLDENNEIIELIENNIEKTDIINANINKIKENNNELAIKIKDVLVEVSGKPSLPTILIITKADTRTLLHDLFNECLNYTLICNENNINIANENLKNNLEEYINDYLNTMHKTLSIYDNKEILTSELKNKLNSVIEIILKEIQTNKNVNEKLYILSVILRNNKIEIDQLITDYLRTMQTKYID